MISACDVSLKQGDRDMVAEQTKLYLLRGGKIKQVASAPVKHYDRGFSLHRSPKPVQKTKTKGAK